MYSVYEVYTYCENKRTRNLTSNAKSYTVGKVELYTFICTYNVYIIIIIYTNVVRGEQSRKYSADDLYLSTFYETFVSKKVTDAAGIFFLFFYFVTNCFQVHFKYKCFAKGLDLVQVRLVSENILL